MENVCVRDIDLLLRDAQVYLAELDFLHHRLSETTDDEQKRIEVRTTTLFKEMMSALYTVLDQYYYYLYCYFQNEGKLSFHKEAFNIKTPVKQTLKYSQGIGQDTALRGQRNEFVNNQCIAIFGSHCFKDGEINNLRKFQDNLLKLQIITEVDQGENVLHTCNPCEQGQQCPDKAPKLVCAQEITHPSGHECLKPDSFDPTAVTFKELKSVENSDSWNETTIFNLLHFFRNFTTHRALIRCPAMNGYLNLDTLEFKAERDKGAGDENLWKNIAKGAWILVPEISHLKDKARKDPPKFHWFPLLIVCSEIVSFVKRQRSLLLEMVGYREPPMAVERYQMGQKLVFKRYGKQIGSCDWNDCYGCFRLWPV